MTYVWVRGRNSYLCVYIMDAEWIKGWDFSRIPLQSYKIGGGLFDPSLKASAVRKKKKYLNYE